jgi:predicted Zn-dependent peptidase
VNEIIKELRDIKEKEISEEELNDTQSYISGSFPLQLETPNAIATKVINLKLYDIESDYYDTFISKVNALRVNDIHYVAEKYLHPDNLTIAIAGNSKDVKDEMKQIGNVEVIEKVE